MVSCMVPRRKSDGREGSQCADIEEREEGCEGWFECVQRRERIRGWQVAAINKRRDVREGVR
jgi:hypothetical protein